MSILTSYTLTPQSRQKSELPVWSSPRPGCLGIMGLTKPARSPPKGDERGRPKPLLCQALSSPSSRQAAWQGLRQESQPEPSRSLSELPGTTEIKMVCAKRVGFRKQRVPVKLSGDLLLWKSRLRLRRSFPCTPRKKTLHEDFPGQPCSG